MKVTIIQMNSNNNKRENLYQAEELITKACEQEHPDLIALPEMFPLMGGSVAEKKEQAENLVTNSETVELLRKLAKKFKIILHAGSLCEIANNHIFNTSLVFNATGQLIAHYRKINLFSFKGQKAQYDETLLFTPGHDIVTYSVNDIKIGCAICFDLRFSSLFQKLIKEHVKVIIVPSAFTYETGKAHWELLCRTRAIETQSFIVAPAQTGKHHDGQIEKLCWGHSMIVDPWGNILTQISDEVGLTSSVLDFNYLEKVRQSLPVVRMLNEMS